MRNIRKIKREQSLSVTAPCWCKSGKTYGECHQAIDAKIEEYRQKGHVVPKKKCLLNDIQIEGVRESGKINTWLLDYISDKIHVGMSTQEIDDLIYNETIRCGATPAPLNYEGYPKSLCTSINDEVCHGIPDESIILQEGDIVNLDLSTIYKGYFSDSARIFEIGKVSSRAHRVVEVAEKSLEVGLSVVKPWGNMNEIGKAIDDYVKSQGYFVAGQIGGHGIGLVFHEEPFVSFDRPGTDMLLVPGTTFTIEPAVCEGTGDVFVDADNEWTIYTMDGSLSAQCEVTLVVTETGYEILSH